MVKLVKTTTSVLKYSSHKHKQGHKQRQGLSKKEARCLRSFISTGQNSTSYFMRGRRCQCIHIEISAHFSSEHRRVRCPQNSSALVFGKAVPLPNCIHLLWDTDKCYCKLFWENKYLIEKIIIIKKKKHTQPPP